MHYESLSRLSLLLSMAAALLSVAVSVLKMELFLAGTQWMLIAIVLGVWSLCFKNCSCGK